MWVNVLFSVCYWWCSVLCDFYQISILISGQPCTSYSLMSEFTLIILLFWSAEESGITAMQSVIITVQCGKCNLRERRPVSFQRRMFITSAGHEPSSNSDIFSCHFFVFFCIYARFALTQQPYRSWLPFIYYLVSMAVLMVLWKFTSSSDLSFIIEKQLAVVVLLARRSYLFGLIQYRTSQYTVRTYSIVDKLYTVLCVQQC